MGSGDDIHTGLQLMGDSGDFFGLFRIIDGYYQGFGLLEPAFLEKFGMGRITIINLDAAQTFAFDNRSIGINENMLNRLLIKKKGDQTADTSAADNNRTALPYGFRAACHIQRALIFLEGKSDFFAQNHQSR